MKVKQRGAVDPPEIAALEAAIVQAQEQKWEVYGVSEEERARQRPGVRAQAKKACDQLRAEHSARMGR